MKEKIENSNFISFAKIFLIRRNIFPEVSVLQILEFLEGKEVLATILEIIMIVIINLEIP